MLLCVLESWFDRIVQWSCQHRHRHAWTSANVLHSWDFQLVLILVALNFHSLCYFHTLEPSKLEGCWSAHLRCARAVSQLVVERQYRRSVSCNVIAWVDCLVTGGVSGQCSVTCSSMVFLFCISLTCSTILPAFVCCSSWFMRIICQQWTLLPNWGYENLQ